MVDYRSKLPRQRSASALRRPFWSLAALIDQGFFLLAGVASFWLAWLVWREGWRSGGWWMVSLFIVVWAITAYLALPRLHRILSSLYVPNYFIGRTRTADGLLGDPVNLALRGSEGQLHRAMAAAGWKRADEITLRSVWLIIVATLTRRSYPHAPVSPLFLFGRRQDFAYQQEVDGNPSKRHHVRFWRCPQGWLLPGGHQVDWLAAGTYDNSVGLSLFTLQITHKIDENIDIERDYIVHTMLAASPAVTVTNLENFSTGYHSLNGGGDTIQTDGDLPVLEVGQTKSDEDNDIVGRVILDATSHAVIPDEHDTLLWQFWGRRPPQIAFGIFTVGLSALLFLGGIIAELIDIEQLKQYIIAELQGEMDPFSGNIDIVVQWVIGVSIIISAAWLIGIVILAVRTFRGKDSSRLLLMSLLAGSALVTSSLLTAGKMTWSTAGVLLLIGLNIMAVMLLSSDTARLFTRTHSRK